MRLLLNLAKVFSPYLQYLCEFSIFNEDRFKVPVRNLFDPRPKSSRNELYDRRQELDFLDKMMNRPLTLVLGIRRIGKTSLIKAFLEPYNGFYVDLHGVNTQLDLYERLAQGLSEGLSKLKGYLMSIRGVSIMGFSVSLKWRGQNSINLLGLLEELGGLLSCLMRFRR